VGDLGAFHGFLAAALDTTIARVELADPPLDPARIVTERYHSGEREWQCVIPGMAGHSPLEDLLPLFEGRELLIPTLHHWDVQQSVAPGQHIGKPHNDG
jgi:hypothetical protein